MSRKCIDLTGQRFGRLVVLQRVDNLMSSSGQRTRWLCACDCGKETVVLGVSLRSGNTRSCGCLQKDAVHQSNGTHYYTGKRLHNIWRGMKARCYISSCSNYEFYGAKGIEVCDEWRNDFSKFKEWALANGYTDELSIDRIDPERDYEPANCRWITMKDNCRNRDKRPRSTNTSGYPGVQWRKDIQKWRVVITVNRKVIQLGNFVSIEDAIKIRKEAEEKYWNA